jgi:organic radical activating enzyme
MNTDLFSPGLHKLILHPEHLAKIKNSKVCGPIHVSVWSTNQCQLNCKYCCFKKTIRNNIELDIKDFKYAIDVLQRYGLKAVELSGGGEPLLWKYFNEAVEYTYDKNLSLSLVSNGLALETIPKEILNKFNWIRISIQSIKYIEKINFDYIPQNVRKSMSFIVYDQKSLNEIEKLYQFSKENNIIIRVAPNRPCSLDWEEIVQEKVNKYGYPLIFFTKVSGKPMGCYFAWIRAGISWDGYFLQCPSVELSFEHFGGIPDEYKLCEIKDLESWIINNPPNDNLKFDCTHCNCGKDVNDMIYNLKNNTMEDIDFV